MMFVSPASALDFQIFPKPDENLLTHFFLIGSVTVQWLKSISVQLLNKAVLVICYSCILFMVCFYINMHRYCISSVEPVDYLAEPPSQCVSTRVTLYINSYSTQELLHLCS